MAKILSILLTIVFLIEPSHAEASTALRPKTSSYKGLSPATLQKLAEQIPDAKRSRELPQSKEDLRNMISRQGPGTSGGGDGLEIEFKRVGLDLIEQLQKAQITELSQVLVEKLKESLVNSIVIDTDKDIYVGEKLKDARNFPLLQGVEVNFKRWWNLRFSEKRQLVVHEILGLMGIDDHHYLRSYYLEKLASMTTAEPSELSRILHSGEETIASAEKHNLAPYQIIQEIRNDKQLNQYFNDVENDLARFRRRQQEELQAAEKKTLEKLYFPPQMIAEAINRSRPSADCRVAAALREGSLVITGESGYEAWDAGLRKSIWVSDRDKVISLRLPLKNYFMGRAYREMFPLQDWEGRNPILIKFAEGNGQILIEVDGRLLTAEVNDGRQYFRCGDFGFDSGATR